MAATEQTEHDLDLLRGTSGLYVGQLTDDERAAFLRLQKIGLAERRYGGPSGFMGLAKVGIARSA